MDSSCHPCLTDQTAPRSLRLRAARFLHRNGPVAVDSAATRRPRGDPDGPGDPSGDHPGIAGGTGIGYGAAAVHSYRLQAKQRGGNTMKEKTKKHKGIGQEKDEGKQ